MTAPPRQPWHEFAWHDTFPATEGWPGGDRWGYQIRRHLLVPRDWTEQEHRIAAALDIVLLGVDSCTVELWWDKPARHYYAVRRPTPALRFTDNPLDSFELPEREVHYAIKYGRRVWDHPNPLPERLYRLGQAGIGEAIQALMGR